MSRLLARPHMYANECIVGYLIRVSERNGFKHIGHLLQHAGLPWKNLRAPTHQIITGEYDIKPYFSALGLKYEKPHTADVFEAAQKPSFSTKIFVRYPKVCPQCLEEDGYCHHLWSYISYAACHKHKIMLVDTAPTTGTRLSWYRASVDKYSDDDLFPISNRIKASADAAALSKVIACLTEGQAPPISSPSILKDLNFAEALSLIHFIAHYQYRLSNSELFSPASMDNLSAAYYYTDAWKSLKQWPKHFNLLLSQYIDNPMSKRGQAGINKHYRDIHEKLHRQRDNKGISRLRAAFDQYIEANWPNAIQINRLTRISLSSDERPLISQKEVLHILNCREPRIHKLISQRQITPHQFKGKMYFGRHEIASLAKLYNDNWSMDQAVAETELSRHQLKQLLDAGLVKALQKADQQNRDWLISKSDWMKKISFFKKHSSKMASQNGKTLSGFQKQGFPITDVFILLKNSELAFSFNTNKNKPHSFKQLSNFLIKKIC